MLIARGVLAVCLSVLTASGGAWEHTSSKVEFVEYREGIIEELRDRERPYFLLFSAEWCHWCHEFGENTLTSDAVAAYLNEHYINVFIDADIHSTAYLKYRATGLPFTVFLNPDTSAHFRYAGTLYADDFLTVIKQVKTNVDEGLSVEGEDAETYAYEPPQALARPELEGLGRKYRRAVLDNFDPREAGLGKGKKAVYPATFIYLLESGENETRAAAVAAVRKTLDRAITRIYDPIEGGFFRYAETRDWQIPHYEKMADLNAGAVLLILRLDALSPAPALVEAADKTLEHLRTTLYDPESGVFLSFQEADTRYYAIGSAEGRRNVQAPSVIRSVFIDRLALTLTHLLGVLDYRDDAGLERQIVSSLDFVARKLEADGAVNRYYVIDSGKWSGKGTLQDYALVSRMFLRAASRLKSARYRQLARLVVDIAIDEFYDESVGVLADPSLGDTGDAEFLMEVNGLVAQTLMGIDDGEEHQELTKKIVTYFSAMGEILEERVWDGENWEFTERYVPYLRAAEDYLRALRVSAREQ